MKLALLTLFSFALALGGVSLFRVLFRDSRRLLDLPNERSSHSIPIIRGAGIAIVLPVLALYILTAGPDVNVSFILAAVIISGLGFLDDLFSLPVLFRFAVQLVAASGFIYSSGGYNDLASLGDIAPVVSVVVLVWITNAFNFMDGIDGIAGAQGIGAAVGWILLGVSSGVEVFASLGSILLGSCVGFILFNWQPAKIFMGDVGSTFLGFTFAALPLIDRTSDSAVKHSELWMVAVFLWLFLFDTAYTRILQILRRRPFWRAHRDHLYQKIAVGGTDHGSVSIFFGMFAIAAAAAFFLVPAIGPVLLAGLLVLGPIGLILWAWKKRLT